MSINPAIPAGLKNIYAHSEKESFKYKRHFKEIEHYCMFIGYPRSGHSLVGSLLDAHPDIIIAHELDVLQYLQAGFKKAQIFYLLLERSRQFTESGRQWGEHNYAVPNQWNGRFRKLKVIGDKKGGASTMQLMLDPTLLDKLKKTIGSDIKFIHVVRNPYDNISTISIRDDISLNQAINKYFSLCATVAGVKAGISSEQWFDIRHETLIDAPEHRLKELCRFLGQGTTDDYLKDCASIVFKSPHKSRSDVRWQPELIRLVADSIEKYPFLHGYAYEEK